MTVVKSGIDAASAVSPSLMAQHGAQFACRYLCPDGQAKQCTGIEVHDLIITGYDVVFVWESDGTPGSGYATGVNAAQQASTQAAARGYPEAPIYFVFADMASPDQGLVGDAIKGAASVIGQERVGSYGGYSTIKLLFDAGLIAYGWQTYAWSGGQLDPRAQLYQWKNGPSVDFDHAMAENYGQINFGVDVALTQADANLVASTILQTQIAFPTTSNPNATAAVQDLLRFADFYAGLAATGVETLSASDATNFAAVQAAIQGVSGTNPQQLATALAGPLATALAPMLPAGLTPQELFAAMASQLSK